VSRFHYQYCHGSRLRHRRRGSRFCRRNRCVGVVGVVRVFFIVVLLGFVLDFVVMKLVDDADCYRDNDFVVGVVFIVGVSWESPTNVIASESS
jgi:hypothetical protein